MKNTKTQNFSFDGGDLWRKSLISYDAVGHSGWQALPEIKLLEKQNVLYKSKHGFTSEHSCDNAISELLEEMLKNKENKKYTISVLLGLEIREAEQGKAENLCCERQNYQ